MEPERDSLRGRGKPWNQRGVAEKFRGKKSLTAKHQNAEPKEVRDFCDSVPIPIRRITKTVRGFRSRSNSFLFGPVETDHNG